MASHSLDVLALLSEAVPAKLAALAESRDGTVAPAVPRLAASVVLCRDGDSGVETFLLHRHARMAFAASMAVFPGGGVDSADRSAGDPLLACAVRETLEETGVRLGAVELLAWAHWITPEVQPIRYDTFFYLAALPTGQTARDISTETERAEWTRPAEAVDAYQTGTIAMMPPTLSILLELTTAASVADLLELGVQRVVEPVLPQVVRLADSWVYRYPRRIAEPSL